MKRLNTCLGVCLLGLLCVLGVQAQRPEPVREGPERSARPVAAEPEAPGEDGTTLGTAPELSVFSVIKFSGVLKDTSGQPRTGTTGITFALYSEQEGGAPLWLETQNIQPDDQGRYTVLLGAMQSEGLPREPFTSGEARWLGIQAWGEEEQARILLVSVPYALKAAEAETLGGRTASEFMLTERLETEIQQKAETIVREEVKTLTEEGSIQAITEAASTFTDNNSTQVVLVTQQGSGIALRGDSTGSTGLLGTTTAPTGRAIFGVALATGNTRAFGMLGRSDSQQGVGFQGTATSPTGPTIGVQGFAFSPAGTAINAVETATSGATVGLRSEVQSSSGTAGLFLNTAGGKILSGVSGGTEVFSVDGTGKLTAATGVFSADVPGGFVLDVTNTNTTGSDAIRGTANSPFGNGVTGEASGTNGIGVEGTSTAADNGTGVFGTGNGTTSSGVIGIAGGDAGTGVGGFAHSTTGDNAGVRGHTHSPQGTGGEFVNFGGGDILRGFTGATQVFKVDNNGEVFANSFHDLATGNPIIDGSAVSGSSSSTSGAGVSGSATSGTGTGVSGSASGSGGARGVSGSASGSFGVGVEGRATFSTGDNTGVWGISDSPDGTAGKFSNFGGGVVLEGRSGSFAGGTLVFSVNGSGDAFFNGALDVDGTGMTTFAGEIQVTDCVKDSGANQIAGTCMSDLRFKKDIEPFGPALERVAQLTPVHFYWRAEEYPEQAFGHSRSYGLIAQEVEAVLPELVTESEDGYKKVKYSKLPLLLLQAIRELKAENDSLEEHRKAQEEQAAALMAAFEEQQGLLQELQAELAVVKAQRTHSDDNQVAALELQE